MMQVNDAPPRHRHIEFAGFRLDPRKRQLSTLDGTTVTLHSRAFDTLLVLVHHHGELVTKQQLLDAVWPGVVVEENNLNQAISALRRAFGDGADRDRIIKTIPGRGYCFVADIRVLDSTAAEPVVAPAHNVHLPATPALRDWRKVVAVLAIPCAVLVAVLNQPEAVFRMPPSTPPASAMPVTPPEANDPARAAPVPNSIAVLPFSSDGLEEEKAYFGDGLHDEILTQLGRIGELNVISRNTMLQYRGSDMTPAQVARELNVATVLEGSVRSAGDDLRISLQMTDPRTSMSLWSATYAADLDTLEDIFAIQADIAANVAKTLQAELLPAQVQQMALVPTNSPAAYKLYLEAAAALVPADYPKALHLLEAAVATDPAFIAAWSQLSMLNTLMTGVPETTPEAHFQQALAAAERALALDADYPMAHVAMAAVMNNASDWERATEEYTRAGSVGAPLDATPMYSLFQFSIGDFDGALATLERNLRTDPINLVTRGFLMVAYELIGDRQRSREEYAKGEAMYPQWWGDNTGVWLALGHRDTAYLDKSIAEFPTYALRDVLEVHRDAEAATAELRRVLRNSGDYKPGQLLNASMWAAYYDEQALAMELLRAGLADNFVSFYLVWLPVFDDLRQSKEFRQFLQESGLIDYWRRYGWPRTCQPAGKQDFACKWRAAP